MLFQSLVVNDAKPIQYVTYKQQPRSQDEFPHPQDATQGQDQVQEQFYEYK